MGVSYDVFTDHFLSKVKDYGYVKLEEYNRTKIVDNYMKLACAQFNQICQYDLVHGDDLVRELEADIDSADLEEIADIISDGMLVQWLKPYMYKQENYENLINTPDYSQYSPAELLYRITEAYRMCKRDFSNKMKDYSYDHGDLSDLHL